MKKFEYKIQQFVSNNLSILEYLETMGLCGWELVYYNNFNRFWFKREILTQSNPSGGPG